MRTLVFTLGSLTLALAAAWHFGALAPLMPALRGAAASLTGTPTADPARPAAATGPGGLRKCVAGERVLYTDTACPPGYATATVQGHVNVVAPVAPVAPASVPAARPAPGTATEGTLRDQMIDRVVNR
ncbi:hypothetical protein KAK07_19415 [Ideonella sp. 4Y16]|uniref:hypothetical protein n=1 Tax=Ideonella alba TaxID=2824118 RepID=UPI001B38FFC7|nr:hypothetical protein [Ideonella alba]MBQ0945517.1 hypothetical protein [Ideonella alba]